MAPPRPAPAPGKQRPGVRQYLKEVRAELSRVVWPTRRELLGYAGVVLVTLVVLTAFVFGLDTLFVQLASVVFGK
jgi:preprotein translocase subunit SecE